MGHLGYCLLVSTFLDMDVVRIVSIKGVLVVVSDNLNVFLLSGGKKGRKRSPRIAAVRGVSLATLRCF